jgi:hypothetical protein
MNCRSRVTISLTNNEAIIASVFGLLITQPVVHRSVPKL